MKVWFKSGWDKMQIQPTGSTGHRPFSRPQSDGSSAQQWIAYALSPRKSPCAISSTEELCPLVQARPGKFSLEEN